MKTFSLKKEEIKKEWVLIDAKDAVLGRLAAYPANVLRGKNKPNYTPNQDCGDNLIIINSNFVHLTSFEYLRTAFKISFLILLFKNENYFYRSCSSSGC